MKKWYAVIGDPIRQSMSPAMHDAWFSENNIDASYIPVHVTPENLESAVKSLKSLGCSGWNVTVPHKSAIIPFLDKINDSAKKMNAVNTVKVLDDGTLFGMNTDGRGFVQSLEEMFGKRKSDSAVLVIGAGGAASGIAYALKEACYGPLTFTNRTIEKAHRLSEDIEGSRTIPIGQAEAEISKFNLIVQTTTVGMNHAQSGMPLSPALLSDGSIVADIIYNPLQTEFLKAAKESGGLTMNGIGMFVHQGALAFELWTGIYPDTEKMIRSISTKLGGN
ncbi:shikimate dehydrogenase [Sporosarcina sp. Sa2YVA2]|uniref:Shikimate dehydrogenase (NADP(+)) n=1 Tax=Sporosarcina quadrami TaxID=2762234 RepID=A0ABR8U5Q3_9BACL|nr:shikimate dehydrogenase [Sporosarcina quadrami]MBD7983089.1 shikimate dehydrogenase [Sporosarcina quadrami]